MQLANIQLIITQYYLHFVLSLRSSIELDVLIYTMSGKKVPLYFLLWLCQMLTNIHNSFATDLAVYFWKNNRHSSHHTSKASSHYLVKSLCWKIVMCYNWVKWTGMWHNQLKELLKKYSSSDVVLFIVFWTAEITERISRFLDRLAFAVLMWIMDVGTLRKNDDTVTTTQ